MLDSNFLVVEDYRVDFDFENGEPNQYSAAVNMALDEYVLEQAAEEELPYLRVYGFEEPAFVPARHTSLDDIDSAVENGFDYTRRSTNGSTIPCLENGVAYSVAYPTGDFPDRVFEERVAPALIDALVSAGISEEDLNMCLEHDAVRYGEADTPEGVAPGRTIAGNSLWRNGGSVMSHGVIAVDPWDAEFLEENIDLRQGEKDFIEELPSVSEAGYGDVNFPELLVEGFTAGRNVPVDLSRQDVEGLLEEKYENFEWVADGSRKSEGHCFVVEDEKGFY